jgi:hypothetical protein
LDRLDKEAKAIEKQITEMVIYSEGAISWSEAWFLSYGERNRFIETLNNYQKAKAGKGSNEYL